MIDSLTKLAGKLEEAGLQKEADIVDEIILSIAKKKEKWMQKVVEPKEKGKFKDWCKTKGHKGVCQSCINDASKAGGHAAKMALFAVNASDGKYKYPKKKKKE